MAVLTAAKIRDLLDAEVVVGQDKMDMQVEEACGADLMSDVLAFVKDQGMLLTGLCNPQVIRTAEMMDMHCVVFVRGKEIDPSIVELARSRDIIVLQTRHRMFSACGLLYMGGLRGE